MLLAVVVLSTLSLTHALECKLEADILYLIDGSGSIGKPAWNEKVIPFFQGLTRNLKKDDTSDVRIGGVVFSFFAKKIFGMEDGLTIDAMVKSLGGKGKELYQGSTTDMWRGFKKSIKQFKKLANYDKKNNPDRDTGKVVIMMTDGEPTGRNKDKAEEAAEELKRRGMRLVVLGVGPHINEAQCKRMASKDEADGKALFLKADSYDAINEKVLQDVTGYTCEKPVKPEPPKPHCAGLIDVVIAIDRSGSIPKDGGVDKIRSFAKKLVDHMQIGPVRLALLEWSSSTEVIFGLDDFLQEYGGGKQTYYPAGKAEMVQKIHEYKKDNGVTNMAESIRWIREVLKRRKVREGAKQVIIFITDGVPNTYIVWNDAARTSPKDFIKENILKSSIALSRTAVEYKQLAKEFPEANFLSVFLDTDGSLRTDKKTKDVPKRLLKWMATLPDGKLKGNVEGENGLNTMKQLEGKYEDIQKGGDFGKGYLKKRLFFRCKNVDALMQQLNKIVGKGCPQPNPLFEVQEDIETVKSDKDPAGNKPDDEDVVAEDI